MERGSTKHGPELDDALKRETSGQIRSTRPPHTTEWRDPEAPGEDQPETPGFTGGTAPGLAPEEVEPRSELARYLGLSAFPAVGQQLLDVAQDNDAPARVVARLRGLPSGREFANVAEVWGALGGGREERP